VVNNEVDLTHALSFMDLLTRKYFVLSFVILSLSILSFCVKLNTQVLMRRKDNV